MTVYERKDGSLNLVENFYEGDENVEYYRQKLYKFVSRLKDAIGPDFDKLFPKPTADGVRDQTQQALGLFDE
ncbi:MAG: hypothetical protein ABJA67_16405 [Chthonomonadales bacterium]